MMLMGYWSCAVQPGTAMTAHGDDEVRRHKGCRTFLLRPRAPRPSDPELPHAEANLPTRYPTHRKQRGGFCYATPQRPGGLVSEGSTVSEIWYQSSGKAAFSHANMRNCRAH